MGEQPYIVSARKYRPPQFRSVVGQEALTSTLKNAIASGRLAQAYLFCGPRGVGKTSCARIFAKTINCLNPTEDGEACGECESCRAIERGTSFNIIELDAASNNSVDDIRNLTEQVNIPPTIGKYRVFIIDEVHMLSTSAFNAFLKTLEEPPKYVIFILATTEKHKVIPTILSRCQIYDFKRITISDMVRHLMYVAEDQGMTAEPAALNVIARKADGAMRDALSIFDQVAASSRGNITYEATVESLNVLDYDYYFRLVDQFRAHDVQGALMTYKDIREHGFDSLFFVNGLAGHIRDLMVAYTPQTASLLEVADDVAGRYTEQARSLPIEWYYAAIELLNECDLNYRTVTDKRLHVELCLIRLARLGLANPMTQVPASTQQPQQAQVQQPQPQQPAPQQPQTQQVQPQQPQQARPQQPVQPKPASARQMQAPAASAGTRHSVRISAPAAKAPSPKAPAAKTPAKQDPARQSTPAAAAPQPQAPAKTDNFMQAWEAFIAANGDKQLLISAMRSTHPVSAGNGRYTVPAVHQGAAQALQQNLPAVTEWLRDTLGDNSITLEVRMAAPQERQRVLSPRESLAKAVQENDNLRSLLESMNAEIV